MYSLLSSRCVKDFHRQKNVPAGQSTDEEMDLQIRLLKDYANAIFSKVAEISEENPDLGAKLQELYAQAGIQPPSRPMTRIGSRASIREDSPALKVPVVSTSAPHSRSSSRASSTNLSRAPSRLSAVNSTSP